MDKTEIIELLQNNTVNITLLKKDANVRNVVCTLIEGVPETPVPNTEFIAVQTQKDGNTRVFVTAWEVNQKEWIKFLPDNIQNTEIV